MKHLNYFTNFVNEKYEHTSEDKEEDMEKIKEFADKFENEFEDKLNLEVKEDAKFQDYLGYGAVKYYNAEIGKEIENDEFEKINEKAFVSISTDINPFGVTKEDDIQRTYSINLELKGIKRIGEDEEEYFDEEAIVKKFFSYSRTMDEVINDFNDWIKSNLNL